MHGVVCLKKCADNLKQQAEVMHDMYKAQALYQNKAFDVQAYDPTRRGIPGKIAELKAEMEKLKNEFKQLETQFETLAKQYESMQCTYE